MLFFRNCTRMNWHTAGSPVITQNQGICHLPDKRFEKLPRCREEIKEHTEPQKEYWAREAVWAYRKLVREGRPVNWTQIRRLTNMKNVDFQGCKPYLRKHAGEDADRLESLL